MSITLEVVKAEQEKLAKMIAELEAKATRTICFPETKIELREGEKWGGVVVDFSDGVLKIHHLILLPGEESNVNWSNAGEWAAKVGGVLPNRSEQALLYANLKSSFQGVYYWSSEQHADASDYAWYQNFDDGHQGNGPKDYCLLARAVRRLVIQ